MVFDFLNVIPQILRAGRAQRWVFKIICSHQTRTLVTPEGEPASERRHRGVRVNTIMALAFI